MRGQPSKKKLKWENAEVNDNEVEEKTMSKLSERVAKVGGSKR